MQLALTVQDKVNGIAGLYISEAVNCKVTPTMPMAMAARGTTNPIALAATKISHCKHAMITLGVTDQHGEKEESRQLIFTLLKLSTGKSVKQTFSDLHRATSYLTLTNGSFGLTKLEVWVNSKLQNTFALTNNQTLSLDLYPAGEPGKNTISLVGFGTLGASANIMVKDDGPHHPDPDPPVPSMEDFQPGRNVWGSLAEETEDNSDLQKADAASQTVRLNLEDALNSNAGSDPSIFTVEADSGETTVVQSVEVQAGANGSTNLVLQLPPGSLQAGGPCVYVSWQNLIDAGGHALSGFVELSPH